MRFAAAIVAALVSTATLGQQPTTFVGGGGPCAPGTPCADGRCSITQGANAVQEAPDPSTVSVAVYAKSGIFWTSGVIVEANGTTAVVLTCWHGMRDGGDSVVVYTYTGAAFAARVLGAEPQRDLLALSIADPRLPVRPLAADPPQPGTVTVMTGFANRIYRPLSGRVVGYVQIAVKGPYDWVQITGEGRNGDSGAAVLNQQGQVVAIVWGSRDGHHYGTWCGWIRRWLAGLLRPLDRPLVPVITTTITTPTQPVAPLQPPLPLPSQQPPQPQPSQPAQPTPPTQPTTQPPAPAPPAVLHFYGADGKPLTITDPQGNQVQTLAAPSGATLHIQVITVRNH
jgi:hypothetical protein